MKKQRMSKLKDRYGEITKEKRWKIWMKIIEYKGLENWTQVYWEFQKVSERDDQEKKENLHLKNNV